MVLVRLGRNRKSESSGGILREANADDTVESPGSGGSGTEGDSEGDSEDKSSAELVPVDALGLARCESALCGQ